MPPRTTTEETGPITLLAILLALIGGLSLWIGVPHALDVLKVSRWTKTTAEVIDNRLMERPSTQGTTAHTRVIRYRYRVGEEEYVGKIVTAPQEFKQTEPGDSLTVHYADDRPSHARISIGLSLNEWLTLVIGVTFTILSTLVFWKRRQIADIIIEIEGKWFGI